jgi:hypothetical protein
MRLAVTGLKRLPDWGGDIATITNREKCIFEKKVKGLVNRWNFNKAFFDEAKFSSSGLTINIPGEKGLYYNNDYYGNESESDQATTRLSEEGERVVKAMQYFVENFCPGTQRKSAF